MAIYYGDGSNSGTGRTVQTVMFEYNSVYSASSNSGFQTILTGAYIQPKNADSKVLVTVHLGRASGPGDSIAFRLLRDRGGVDITAIGVNTGSGNFTGVSFQKYAKGAINNDHADGHCMQFLDTHGDAVGDSCYYNLQMWGQDSGTMYINRTQNENDVNQAYSARTGSQIILTEITN